MQRIKGMMSGSLPTFIDAGSNFNSYIVEEDNLIRQASLLNKSTIIMGDDTWISLFEERLFSEIHVYPSFDVKDIDTVDNNVREKLIPKLAKDDWHLLIAHFLGVDHVGHTYGAKNKFMRRKLNEIDDILS
jgi:GPI ethanolamine phosphate transferase 3 subunit O